MDGGAKGSKFQKNAGRIPAEVEEKFVEKGKMVYHNKKNG